MPPGNGFGMDRERIRAAVERGEFALHYQPQFDLSTLRPTGLEALLRWRHPDVGLIGPAEFLPALRECGLMPTLTRWTLREAIDLNARLTATGTLNVPIAVNIGTEIFEDRDFVGLVSHLCDERGLAPDRVEVEVTETTAITDPAQVTANVSALRLLGVGVAIDDFGTGFSSIERVTLANFSKLKIDRSFVGALPGGITDRAAITNLLDLAQRLGMKVVAEGIETAAQLRFLRMLGCRYGQGYFYSRAMPEPILHSWIGGLC